MVNALRNLSRSTMTVLAMALAAFMMTASLTITEGYTPARAATYRDFLGGDLLVYPAWTYPTEAEMDALTAGAARGRLRLAALPPSFVSPLRFFHPNYYWDGYLAADTAWVPGYSMFRSRTEMSGTVSALRGRPEVSSVAAYSGLPVVGGTVPDGSVVRECPPTLLAEPGRETVSRPGDEPGRPVRPGSGGPAMYLDQGRWLTSADGTGPSDSRMAAMVNRAAMPGAAPGQILRLELPRVVVSGSEMSEPTYAGATETVAVDVEVVGVYQVYGRLLHYNIDKQDYYEALFLDAPEILLAPSAYQAVLEAVGVGPETVPPVGALVVGVHDLSRVEALAAELRSFLPGYSVVTVARELTYANARGLPEPIHLCPWEHRPRPLPLDQPVVPAGSKFTTGAILFAFAGLVAAGNATMLVVGRRKEFAILKATGLRGFEVAGVILVEVVTLAVMGLALGFGAAELSAMPILLTNKIAAGELAARLLRDLGVVGAATVGASVVFALIPMIKTLSISVAEVMRDEA